MTTDLATNNNGATRLIKLNSFDNKQYNTLMPMSVEQLSPMHSVRYFEVKLDPSPNAGDVYPESGKLALTKRALFTLADAAGVIWYPGGCKRMDRMDNPDYCAWQVQGGIRRPDGTVSWITASKEIDLRAIEDAAEQKRVRKHKAALCETKAYLRALRMLLHVKSTYTAEEINKPFVVAQAFLDPTKMDDEAKRIWKIKVTREMDELFPQVDLPAPRDLPQLGAGTVVDDDEDDDLPADDLTPQGDVLAYATAPAEEHEAATKAMRAKCDELIKVIGTPADKLHDYCVNHFAGHQYGDLVLDELTTLRDVLAAKTQRKAS